MIEKRWNLDKEKEISEKWRKAEIFNFNSETKKKIYSIDTPPPYINSPIHMGHAVTYCFMDMIARFRRMKGFEVLFPLGLDKNGLPIEMAAEKKFNVSPFDVGRKKFIEYCEKLLKETSIESIDTFARLGISFSSYKRGKEIGRVYETDSSDYRNLTQETFIDLYKKGLIYEDTRINNWDPELQTTISDSEIEYKEKESVFNYIEWKVKETGEEIIIGTTRPELIATCGMIIFNPDDQRYNHLDGKTVVSPIYGKEIQIKKHPLAEQEKGTGIVMMCSAGDLSDIQFFREQKLNPIIAINKDGTMNENAGFLKGLKVSEARKKIIEEVRKRGLLKKQEKITHKSPISERSGAEVEFIEMNEFYLKQLEFKSDIKKIGEKINFYPPESKKLLDKWIESIAIDWPISRRRYYATEVPLWYSESKHLVVIPRPGKYYRPWKESPPKNAEVLKNGKKIGEVKNFDEKWVGETRVLDTWMDSSISELNIIKYKSDSDFFKKAFPISLRPQGKEIVRTWLYYTLLRGYLETKKPCFKDVWIHQHILDEKGGKMSKSKGNVIDPVDILNEEGAEALRLWSAIEGDLSKGDFICSREKIKAERKTINKILNVARFILLFNKPKKPGLTRLDKLFIEYIEDMTKKVEKSYKNYDFNHPSQELRYFLWNTLASHYLEIIKNRVYNKEKVFSKKESDSAKYTLHYLLERFLILIYPIIPQVAVIIGKEKGIDLLKEKWPVTKPVKTNLKLISEIMSFNSKVWKFKKEKKISLRSEIKGIKIPVRLKDFKKDLIACHNLK